jgi:hypothetical protein
MFLVELFNLFLCLLSPGNLTPSKDFILLKKLSACSFQFSPAIKSGDNAIINSPPLAGPPSLLSSSLASN